MSFRRKWTSFATSCSGNGIDLHTAWASFVDEHTIRLDASGTSQHTDITADKVVIATGTTAARDPHIPFDGQRIFTSDDMLDLEDLPRTMTIIGGGVIGVEFATIFAILGVRVTLIDARPRLLDFVDAEIIDLLVYNMRRNRVTLRLGEEVTGLETAEEEGRQQVRIKLKSGKQIASDKALYSIGRQGATDKLDLGAAGLEADSRGRIKVNEFYQTDAENIYAVGDVIGFRALPRPQASKDASPHVMPSVLKLKVFPISFPMASMPSLRFRRSERARKNSPRKAYRMRSARRSTRKSRAGRSLVIPRVC